MSLPISMLRVADYIVHRLVEAGFSEVFLVTGGGAMHLNDAFARHPGIKVTCFHHEQAAAIAAEAYTRVNQVPCAINVTTGPGGLNALVGVYGAYVDSIPMMVISGQVKLETVAATYPLIPMRQLGDQEIDIVSMVRPIVKYVKVVKSTVQIEIIMDRALFIMKHGRPGPVWIDVPIDIQGARMVGVTEKKNNGQLFIDQLLDDEGLTPNTFLELQVRNLLTYSSDLFTEALQRLEQAKRPVILVGTGVTSCVARSMFLQWINSLDVPVVPGWNAMDIVPTDHKNFSGRPGTVGDRAGNFAVQNADFILVIGCRLNIRQISYNWKSFAKNAFKVMIDVDQAELDKPTLSIDLKIHATAETFLKVAVDSGSRIQNKVHQIYRDWCLERVKNYPVVQESYRKSKILNPYYFLHELSKVLPEDAIVVAGNGAACVMTFQAFEVKSEQRIFTNSGCASMGYDLPAGIGASIASCGKRKIYCIAGDGSIMMNLQELQTIVSNSLPVKIILLNNEGYLSIKLTQSAYFADNIFGTGPSNGVGLPSFKKIAQAFGLQYGEVKSIEDFHSDRIQELLMEPGSAFIEVFVDAEQSFLPKLASRKNDDGSMTSPELEDMAPFLTREELFSNILK